MSQLTAIPTGEMIENTATGERAWIEASARTGSAGASIVFELPPGAEGAPPHHHGSYDESFVVLSGALEVRIGDAMEPRVLRAGESVVVRRGTPHAFRNATSEPVLFRTIVDEGHGFERFIRAWYGLGRSGQFAYGAPLNPLHLAMALDAGDVNLVGAPRGLQRWLRRALARLARLTGADVSVTRHWERAHV